MASNVVCLFSLILVLVYISKIEGELNKNERLTSFLAKYEIAEITEIPRRSTPLKFDEIDNSERSFRITAFGNTFLIDLTVFFPREDVKIDYVSKFQNNTRTFYETDFMLYHGYVRNVNSSFVLGYFAKEKPFRGYMVTDEIFCIEPYESKAVIVYRFKDVITPGCSKRSEDEELDCAETRYFAPWYANRAPPIRLLSRYNLFYDKYLRFYQRLQAKKAEAKKGGGPEDNSTTHGKDRGNKGDPNTSDRSKNDKTVDEKSKSKNYYSKGDHDIKVKSDSETKTGYPKMIKITDKNEIREYIRYKKEKNESKEEKEKDENDDDDDDDDDDYIKISADGHRLQAKKAEAKKEGGHEDNSTTHGKNRGNKGDLNKSDRSKNNKTVDEKPKAKNYYSKGDHDIRVKSDSETKPGYPEIIKITDKNEIREYIQYKKEKNESKQNKEKDEKDDDDDDDDYIKISVDDRLFRTKIPSISDKRSKNKTKTGQKLKVKTFSTEHHAITHDIEYRTTTEFPKTIIILDQKEIRKYRQYLKEKDKPNIKKEKVEKNYDNGHYEKDNEEILRDDDRFTIPENNVAYRKHLVDKDDTSESSRLDTSGSRNIMNHFDNIDFAGMWTESVQKAENYEKQVVKREEKPYMEPIVEALTESHPVEAAQCYVQLIVSPSLLRRFDNDPDMLIKDIYIQFTLLNKILLKLPLQRRGKEIRFTLQVKEVVIHGDQVYSPFMGDRVDLESFTKSNRGSGEHCLSIGLLNKYLRSGELYDGYTPEGQGGICSRNGNTLLVSHGNEHTLAPMALYFASLVRGITRAIGAKDKNSDCQKGTYPNPMQILRYYLLTEKIVPSTEYSIFTQCNVKEIEHELDMRACFYSVSQPLCGNAILDPGEECDCGPIVKCGRLEEGCNNPNLYLDPPSSELKDGSGHRGCTLKKNYECSAHEACCDLGKISETKRVCYSGPFDCDISTCDDKSASCPAGVEASNGMICSTDEKLEEPLICKDKKCDQLLCSSFDLKPCTCATGTEEECLYCCMKDGRCQTAGIELTLFPKRNYTLPDGKECKGGQCINGKCETFNGERVFYNNTMNKSPRFPAKSDSPNEFSTFHIILGTVFSLLVLFLLKL